MAAEIHRYGAQDSWGGLQSVPTVDKAQAHTTAALVATLLQDSYLLVIGLRLGRNAHNRLDLWPQCVKQIEDAREQLKQTELSQSSIDYITFAQCALVDAVVLGTMKGPVYKSFARQSLQALFFQHHRAGEIVYRNLDDILREPQPEVEVLKAFQRIFVLGFHGRYALDDPERLNYLSWMNERIAQLETGLCSSTQIEVRRRAGWLSWLASPKLRVAFSAGLLLAMAWGMDHSLRTSIARLESAPASVPSSDVVPTCAVGC